MDSVIFYGGGAFAILYLLFINIFENHDNQNGESNERSNNPFQISSNPFQMSSQEPQNRIKHSSD